MRVGLLSVLVMATASAQDVVHYKFDDHCGTRVVNYAYPSPAPREGTVSATSTWQPWTQGLWGGAFDANTPSIFEQSSVDTGWAPGGGGSFSYAAWVRIPGVTSSQFQHTVMFAGGTGPGFFSGVPMGLFNTSLLTQWRTASGGQATSLSAANVRVLAQQRWVHLAAVIDVPGNHYTLYVDGAVDHSFSLTGMAPGSWTGNLIIGAPVSSGFLMDEVVVATRAFSAAEVALLVTGPRAAAGPYGAGGCRGAVLNAAGGLPRVPNPGFQLQLNDSNGLAGIYSMSIATNRCRYGAIPIPFDLGLISSQLAGCIADAPNDLGVLAGSYAAGTATASLPIPGAAIFIGFPVYCQAFLLEIPSGVIRITNAEALGLGL